MDKTAASCYVFSKASGMLASSYTGKRASILKNVKSLEELWSLLFTEDIPDVSQTELVKLIEKKGAEKFVKEYKTLLYSYSKPAQVCVELLDSFEKLNFENNFDTDCVRKLYKAAEKLPLAEREEVKKIIVEKYSIQNILWVLRLKVYYKLSAEEIKKQIFYLDESNGASDVFASEALKVLNWKIEDSSVWSKWKYSKLLTENNSSVFKLDLIAAEQKAAEIFNIKMRRAFHKEPFTSLVLVSWFFIKQSEFDLIRSVSEALRLNVELEQAI